MGRLLTWDEAVERAFAMGMSAPDGSREEAEAQAMLFRLLSEADAAWQRGAKVHIEVKP